MVPVSAGVPAMRSGAAMAMETVVWALRPDASVARTVMPENVPALVGFPEIRPVEPSSESPSGSAPAAMS